MKKKKYLVQQDLIATMFKKLDKDARGYENRFLKLTNEELECKIKGLVLLEV